MKRSFQPTRVDMLPLALRQAMTTMLSGRPGPVNIDVPFNVFQEEDDVEMPPPAPPFNTQRSGASPEDIARALDMILARAAAGASSSATASRCRKRAASSPSSPRSSASR